MSHGTDTCIPRTQTFNWTHYVTWSRYMYIQNANFKLDVFFYFRKRKRAADILKSSRSVGESKYDFSKILKLKGENGRDVSKKGRPEGISCVHRDPQQHLKTFPNDVDQDAVSSDLPLCIKFQETIFMPFKLF